MEQNELISIITPVYNAKKYLNACIEAVLYQTYENFELILIDDGSKDGSAEICDQYQSADSRIKVLHKENGGASSARNAGLDFAQGEYIIFQDSDDILYPNALETLYTNLKIHKADMCIGSIDICKNDQEILNYSLPIEQDLIVVDEREYWNYTFINYTATVPWAKIYKKSVWKDVRFLEGVIHEDEQILQYMLCKCSKIVLLRQTILKQNIVDGSVMNRKFRYENLDKSEFMLYRYHYFHDKAWKEYYMKIFGEGTRVLLEGREKLDYKNDDKMSNRINKLYMLYKEVAKEILQEKITLSNRVRLHIFRISFPFYGLLRKIVSG